MLKQNYNELKQTAEERYKQGILSLLGVLREQKPLPAHLDYMVSVVNRLSPTPQIVMSVIPNKPDAKTGDIIACMEATLPAQMDLPDGIRWLEDQVMHKGLDIRDMLSAAAWGEANPDAKNPGH